MKYFWSGFVLVLLIHAGAGAAIPEPPFKRGVNLEAWFRNVGSAQGIQFEKFTKTDFGNIRSLGCDHVRLPIGFMDLSGPPPDHVLDPLFFFFLDQVADWCEELGLYLILDNHTFDPSESTGQDILDHLIPVWTQVAERYKNRSRLILYEILNEPHGISDAVWNDVQWQVVQAIRAVDTLHTLVVGPASWNSYTHLDQLPVYPDTNLIYTFHFYDPFLFTHQGADWTDPSMESLAGVPYPYDASRMPVCPQELKGTWVGSSYNAYPSDGNVGFIRSLLDIAVRFGEDRQVPLWCGEFGVFIPNSPAEDRAQWHMDVRSILETNSIAWTLWEYAGGFGIFNSGSYGLFGSDVNVPLTEALGLTAPPQTPYIPQPDSAGFVIYDDVVRKNVIQGSWLGDASVSYYSGADPAAGNYCIEWSGASQYNALGFRFVPVRDLTRLRDENFRLDFWIRGEPGFPGLDVRFLDTDMEDPADHPWRMRVTLNSGNVTWDGTWQHMRLLLRDFSEQGAWDDNTWFNPEGLFDWSAVDAFEIVAEQAALTGETVYFDEIRIMTGPDITGCPAGAAAPSAVRLNPLFPNPFNQGARISFDLPSGTHVRLEVFNVAGQRMAVLENREFEAGSHDVIWQPAGLSSGLYLIRLQTGSVLRMRRCVLLK
ncbi:cellulase family glycosylhydrolase [bacterium]|nr:cellulase family glycosylhydrolase [bacterium]